MTVVSGTWSLGYGSPFESKALKSLPPGSFYTEPPGVTSQAPVRSGFGAQTTARRAMDPDLAERLWTKSEEWTGVTLRA